MIENGIDYANETLILTIPEREYYDEEANEFITVEGATIRLKHSLLSLSKWEAKYERPFLDVRRKPTYEETLDYIQFMTLTQNVDPNVYSILTNQQIDLVNKYIGANMNGTTFGDDKTHPGKGSRNPMSAEVIYYYMCEFNIPFECRKWHLNRLLTLIRVCGLKKSNPKKSRQTAKDRQRLNSARRKRSGSRG